MAEPDFEIDHYKDASYPPVASHYHEFYEIFLFVSGNADYVVHDKMFRLKPGDLLIIPPAIMHHPIFRDFEIPYERYVLWLSPPAFDVMKKIDPDIDYFLRPPTYSLKTIKIAHPAIWKAFGSCSLNITLLVAVQIPMTGHEIGRAHV